MKNNSTQILKALDQNVQEAEQAVAVGKKQRKIDNLKKVIDMTKDELNFIIKNNSYGYRN